MALESDKATMEVPAPLAAYLRGPGKVGDKVSEGRRSSPPSPEAMRPTAPTSAEPAVRSDQACRTHGGRRSDRREKPSRSPMPVPPSQACAREGVGSRRVKGTGAARPDLREGRRGVPKARAAKAKQAPAASRRRRFHLSALAEGRISPNSARSSARNWAHQENLGCQPASQLGRHHPACHDARRGRHHRSRTVPRPMNKELEKAA